MTFGAIERPLNRFYLTPCYQQQQCDDRMNLFVIHCSFLKKWTENIKTVNDILGEIKMNIKWNTRNMLVTFAQ
jgi:hypothetical protein